jgi:hypothetical protein
MFAQHALHGRARHAEQAGKLGRRSLAGFRLGNYLCALLAGEAWSASKVPTSFAGMRQAVHGALANHSTLELGKGKAQRSLYSLFFSRDDALELAEELTSDEAIQRTMDGNALVKIYLTDL